MVWLVFFEKKNDIQNCLELQNQIKLKHPTSDKTYLITVQCFISLFDAYNSLQQVYIWDY